MDLSPGVVLMRLAAVAGLVAMNGLFVAAEFAIVASRRTRVATLVRRGGRAARLVQRAVDNPEPFVAATQLGITMASLALGWVGEPFVAEVIRPALVVLPTPWQPATLHTVSAVMAFGLITALHIIAGELAPKSVALWNPESTALLAVPPTAAFARVCAPFIIALNGLANATLRLAGLRAPAGRHVAIGREDLVMLVGEARRAGVVDHQEESLVRRVFRLTDRTVGDIMVHRTAAVTVPATATIRQAVEVVRQRGFTRLPVTGADRDEILGAVHAKDLLIHLADGRGDLPVTAALRPVLYVPETKPVVDLLEEMRAGRSQMAVVLEEYGSTAGIVTIEDLLEEIVGEIPGETRPQPPLVHLAQPDRVVVDATIDLQTLQDLVGVSLPRERATTLGGFIFYHLGSIPEPGARFRVGDLEFTVETVVGRRIGRVEIRRVTPRPDATGPTDG